MSDRVRRREDDYGAARPDYAHCHIVETGNESYRFRQSTADAKARIAAREQSKRGKIAVAEDAPF